jgi:hypothetical protein
MGAFTASLVDVIKRQVPVTNRQLLMTLNARLTALKLPKQRPQLSASELYLLDACCPLTVPPPVAAKSGATAGLVTLYAGANFEGGFVPLPSTNKYDRAQLQGFGMTPGTLRSLVLAPMTGIKLYSLPGFSGKSLDLRGYLTAARAVPDLGYYGFSTVSASAVVYKL